MPVELSADLGEGSPNEDEVWQLVDAANVACGGHTGDDTSMAAAARTARERGVLLGAHPSYPDRENFGRRSIAIEPARLRDSLIEQLERLRRAGAREGVEVRRVKPHGALYNDAHARRDLADVIVSAIRAVDPAMAIVCSAASQMAVAARESKLAVVREAFADRGYHADGSLVPRSEPGALLDVAAAVAQAESLARWGTATAVNGAVVPIAFETICIHADMERATERVAAIRRRLGDLGLLA